MICVDEAATTYPEKKMGKKDHSILIICKMALAFISRPSFNAGVLN